MYFSQAIIAVIKEISDSGTYKYYNNIQCDQIVFENFLLVWIFGSLFSLKLSLRLTTVKYYDDVGKIP